MSLAHLWAGWRSEYVGGTGASGAEDDGCVFCAIFDGGDPAPSNGLVWRNDLSAAVLNAFPYTSGHLLVMPVRHVGELADLTPDESSGVWQAMTDAVAALNQAYRPDGVNLGANLGRAAGAGIPGHVHLHALPRWAGDTNFMTAIAETRVMPESLDASWRRVHAAWPAGNLGPT